MCKNPGWENVNPFAFRENFLINAHHNIDVFDYDLL